MSPANHLSFEDLVNHAVGDADAETSARVTARVSTDAAVARTLDLVNEIVAALGVVQGDLPPGLIERVQRMVDAQLMQLPSGFQPVEHALATLVEDTREPDALIGFRGEATAYQLCFDAEFAEVHLQVTTESGSACRVRGQVDVYGDLQGDITMKFRRTGVESWTTVDVDATGQFVIELAPATYDLVVTIGEQTLLIPTVEIG